MRDAERVGIEAWVWISVAAQEGPMGRASRRGVVVIVVEGIWKSKEGVGMGVASHP